MQTQTSSDANGLGNPAVSVVSRSTRGDRAVEAPRDFPSLGVWRVEANEISAVEAPLPEFSLHEVEATPMCVYDFVQAVAKIPAVNCVVAEQVDGCVHVTTFVVAVPREDRERIYSIEAEIIRANPSVSFDFHVRNAVDASGGTPDATGGHLFAVWGALENVDSR